MKSETFKATLPNLPIPLLAKPMVLSVRGSNIWSFNLPINVLPKPPAPSEPPLIFLANLVRKVSPSLPIIANLALKLSAAPLKPSNLVVLPIRVVVNLFV